jgi:hypothetical protein
MKQLTATLILALSVSFAYAETEKSLTSTSSEEKVVESVVEIETVNETVKKTEVATAEVVKEPAAVVESEKPNLHLDSLKNEAQKISDQLDSIEALADAIEDANRPEGVGGAGGPIFRVYSLDVTPIKNLIKRDIAELGDKSYYSRVGMGDKIDGTYETFMSLGGRGLYGLGKGFKVGGEFASLWKRYRSTIEDTSYNTILFTMYGGAIIEKSFKANEHSFTVGTMLGGGAMGITGGAYEIDGERHYEDYEDNDYDDDEWEWESDVASLFAGDLHLSYNYSILPWMHIGVEANALLLASSAGFKYGESFTTINPGGGLKLMFGRVN